MIYELNELECLGMHISNSGDLICASFNFIHIEQSKIDQFEKSLVYQALVYMQKRHPFLRAHLKKNLENKKYFIEIKDQLEDEIELEWNDLRQDENTTRQEIISKIERFNCLLFKMDSILWRTQIILFKEFNFVRIALTISFPIFLTDGINISTLSVELINALNHLLERGQTLDPIEVIKPAESLYTLCERYNFFQEKHKQFIKSYQSNGKKFLLSEKLKSIKMEHGFKLDLIKIDKEKSKKIIELSRMHGVKLTAYLSVLSLYALKNLYELNQIEFDQNLVFNVAFNMRIRYEPNLDFNRMNWQVGASSINLENGYLTYSNVWTDTAKIDKMIEKFTNIECESFFNSTHNHEFLTTINSIYEESKDIEQASDKVMKFKTTDLSISNAGRYVWDRVSVNDGALKIDEMYFSDASNAPNSFYGNLIFHTSYWNDQIMIQLSSNLVAISYQNVNKLIEIFKGFIEQSLI